MHTHIRTGWLWSTALIALLAAAGGLVLAQDDAPPAPTLTPTAPVAGPTPTEAVVIVEPLAGVAVPPPLEIELPEGWRYGYDTFIFESLDDVLEYVPFAVYTGPVTGGTATIVVLWNFRSIASYNPFAGSGQADLWGDGLRLLRTIVIERTCNIGTDPQRFDYTVGGREATGTSFAAVDCDLPNTQNVPNVTVTPDPNALPDTRGWFAGLNVDGMPFLFYVFTDPIQAMDGPAPAELQAILDTVEFRVQEFIEEHAAEATPEATPEATADPGEQP